jgi:hypothetical protein
MLPPNFRIREGVMQVSVPVKVSVLGMDQNVVLVTRGDFARDDGRFVFVPASMTLGSCQMDRLPYINAFVFKKFVGAQSVPEDIATAWAKVIGVHVEANELKLTMP